MAKRKTPAQRVEAALQKLGLTLPDEAPGDPEVHPFLRRVITALAGGGPYRAKLGSWEIWSYAPALAGLHGKGGRYLELGHADGGNYTVFVYDFGAENPSVYRYDHECFDEETEQPTSATRLSASFATFVGKLRPEVKKKPPAKKAARFLEATSTVALGRSARHFALAPGRMVVDAYAEPRRCVLERDGEDWKQDATLPVGSLPSLLAFDGMRLVSQLSGGIEVAERQPDGTWKRHALPLPAQAWTPRFALAGDLLALSVSVGGATTVHLYTPVEGRWELCQELAEDDRFFGAKVAVNRRGEVLVVGGAGHYLYAPAHGSWTRAPVPEWEPLFPGWSPPPISAAALGDELLVLGSARDGLDAPGWDTASSGREVQASGTVYIAERAGPAWGALRPLKVDKPRRGEGFGRFLALQDGLLMVVAQLGRAPLQRARLFARAADGSWVLRAQLPDVDGSEAACRYALAGRNVGALAQDGDSISLWRYAPAIREPQVRKSRKRAQKVRVETGHVLPQAGCHNLGGQLAASGACIAVQAQGALRVLRFTDETSPATVVEHAASGEDGRSPRGLAMQPGRLAVVWEGFRGAPQPEILTREDGAWRSEPIDAVAEREGRTWLGEDSLAFAGDWLLYGQRTRLPDKTRRMELCAWQRCAGVWTLRATTPWPGEIRGLALDLDGGRLAVAADGDRRICVVPFDDGRLGEAVEVRRAERALGT